MRGDFESFLSISEDETAGVYDQLEPQEHEHINEYREASRKMLAFVFSLIDFI